MLWFPREINQIIIEEVGFEYGPQLKEYISTFKALNSIPELKPIIAKYISIWVSIPSSVKYNYLRHSETLRSLRDCTDSFFISTNDEPLRFGCLEEAGRDSVCGPLIFDIHNYLGMKLKDGLNLGIQKVDVVIENLFFLSDKRPKRILELVLPRTNYDSLVSPPKYFEFSGYFPRYSLRNEVIIDKKTCHDIISLPVGERYNVPIDHQTFDWAKIDDFDEHPSPFGWKSLTCLYTQKISAKSYLSVAPEFWGPTPFLTRREISHEKIPEGYGSSQWFIENFRRCRDELWSDYQNQLYLSEYCRINAPVYYDMIETLATEQWK